MRRTAATTSPIWLSSALIQGSRCIQNSKWWFPKMLKDRLKFSPNSNITALQIRKLIQGRQPHFLELHIHRFGLWSSRDSRVIHRTLKPEKERSPSQTLSYDVFAGLLICGSSLPPKHQSNHTLRTKAKYCAGTAAIGFPRVGPEYRCKVSDE
jgi:hypothetical protein